MLNAGDGVVLDFINFTSVLRFMVKFGVFRAFIVSQRGLVSRCCSVVTNFFAHLALWCCELDSLFYLPVLCGLSTVFRDLRNVVMS